LGVLEKGVDRSIGSVVLGFTNDSRFNLFDFEGATQVDLSRTTLDMISKRSLALVKESDRYRIWIKGGNTGFLTEPVALNGTLASLPASVASA
jgi:hypothetical protein